ncbi:TIR domain-containing protein [Novosphingobium aquiterrae]|uniref:TIR domain-containing protein n=1 Tax=Novosphingobium aquiterrae TaxID=624388 RepID=A0ABV6PFU1_9SPHN
MPEVFISYNRQDQEHARLFADGLKAEGFDVWWDVTLRAGQAWDAVTEKALNDAEAVVVLWSQRSVNSRWVRSEAAVAQRNGTLVPVMIEACTRPVMFELTQSADLIEWTGDRSAAAWNALVADIRCHLEGRRSGGRASGATAPRPAGRIGSERRQVTVLNAALALDGDSEPPDPEDWEAAVRQVQAAAHAAAAPFEATVIGSGTGATVLFGYERITEHDALNAVRAALDLVAKVGAVALPGDATARVRGGIDTGSLVAGPSGSIPAGLALDSAAQLQMLAAPGSILIGSAVATIAGGFLELERAGPRAFRVIGESATHTRFELSRARGLSRFVGREEEFELLMEGLERSNQGAGQVIGVMAEAGTGKSRLFFEFSELCRRHDIPVYAGSAAQQSQNTPLRAIIEVLRSFFAIEGQDDPAAARARIAARITALDPRMRDTVPLVCDLAGYPDLAAPAVALDPEARLRQLVGLLRHLIRLDSVARPSVMVVEDLHWIDDASARVLEQLVEGRDGLRNLMLLNYRPEFRATWMQNSNCRQISLAPLDEADIGGLLGDLLGEDPSLAVLAAPIATLTKGNPYFVEEIVQTLAETGTITGERGAYRLAGAFKQLEVPPTIKAVVAARIDRLPPEARAVLQAAAVIGMTFPEPLLAQSAQVAVGDLAQILALLRRNEFIVEQAAFPVVEYAFKHPLTLEMAQASLVRADRRKLHRRVAEALEQAEPARLDELAGTLAAHWEEAGEPIIAAQHHRRAAMRVVRTDFPTCAWHWHKVRELARGNLTAPEHYELIFNAYINLLNFNYRVGSGIEDAQAVLAEGEALAAQIGDEALRLTLALCYSRAVCAAGDAEDYFRQAQANYTAAFAQDVPHLRPLAALLYCDSLAHSARNVLGLEEADKAMAAWPADLQRGYWISGNNPHTFFAFIGGMNLTWLGRHEEARARLEAARLKAIEDDTPEVVGWCGYGLTQVHTWLGDGEGALAHARAVAEISEKLGSPLLEMYRHLCFAMAYGALGQPEQAIPEAEAAIVFAQTSEKHWTGGARAQLAMALIAADQAERAAVIARQAVDDCEKAGTAHFGALAMCALARALALTNGSAAGEEIAALFAVVEERIESGAARALAPYLSRWRGETAETTQTT